MKKFLAIVAIAAFMTSCNDSASTTEVKTDSAAVVTPAPTDSASVVAPADTSKTEAHAADTSKVQPK